MKGVLYCDVLNDNVVPDNTSGKFDCITSSACLDAACTTHDSFRKSLRRISGLLNEGGHVAILCFLGDSIDYDVGDKTFAGLSLTKDDVLSAYKEADFGNIQSREKTYTVAENVQWGFLTLCASKLTPGDVN